MLDLESATQTAVEAPSSAALQAAGNWRHNLAALARTQAELAASLTQINPKVEWIFARDGALTAFETGTWWGGCSVPLKAAEELLNTLQITVSVACFLAPAHSAQIAFALRRLKSDQAVIALQPSVNDLVLTLHCLDFSGDIISHRLWFTAGEQWQAQMAELFRSNPGLGIPQQFIRTALLSEDTSAPLVASAQKIFIDELNHRTARLSQLRQSRSRQKVGHRKRIALAAPTRFRLWDDAGGILAEIIANDSTVDWTIINFDDPISASALALAAAAAESDAVLTSNITRADCGEILHRDVPLISWLTRRAIPSFDTAGPYDVLLLTDTSTLELARKSGWPAQCLAVASWPTIFNPVESDHLAIVADTHPIQSNPAFDLSSHQLLWDLIRNELESNPALVEGDVLGYLHSRMKRLGVTDHGLDQRRFIEELIIPCYQQSIAAQLIKRELPLQIFGRGWSQIPAFTARAIDTIEARDQLRQIMKTTAALVYIWPGNLPHSIETAGPPVVRLTSRGMSGLIADARLALRGGLKPPPPRADSLDMASIARILRPVLAS